MNKVFDKLKKAKPNYTIISLNINSKLYSRFKEVCDKNGFKYKQAIEALIKDFLEDTEKK